jgi:hypothetical protein
MCPLFDTCVTKIGMCVQILAKLCQFYDLTAAVKNSSIFWDITSCSPLKVDRRFGGICCTTSCYLLHACHFLWPWRQRRHVPPELWLAMLAKVRSNLTNRSTDYELVRLRSQLVPLGRRSRINSWSWSFAVESQSSQQASSWRKFRLKVAP